MNHDKMDYSYDNHTEQGVLFDVINHHDHIDVAIHLWIRICI